MSDLPDSSPETSQLWDRASDLTREAVALDLRIKRLKEQEPVVSERSTRAERRALVRWRAKAEQFERQYARFTAKLAELAHLQEEPPI